MNDSGDQNQQFRYINGDPTLQFRFEIELLKEKLAASLEKNVLYENRIAQYENQIEQNKNQLEFLQQIIKNNELSECNIEDEFDDDEEGDEMDECDSDEDYIDDGSDSDDTCTDCSDHDIKEIEILDLVE